MTTEEKKLESIEIYPKIVVYKNVFKDINKTIDIIKKSESNNDDRLFTEWRQWSWFGEYLSPILFPDKLKIREESLTQNQKDQRDLYNEIIDLFHLVTRDYCDKFKIDIFNNLDKTIVNYKNHTLKQWIFTGPDICKWKISDEDNVYKMNYHSDYQIEKWDAPGHNFVVTALAYYNDDYEGGELDFCIGKKLVKYKPEAGDYIVFPSGHPDFLTEDGISYLHGVMPAKGKNKYFSRMYWRFYRDASEDWIKNESELGTDVWLKKREEIEKAYRDLHPQRNIIENGIRIR